MKVVIPVAGLGTRMLPATKAIPKEMLPLVDKPLIQYIVKECYDAGFSEVVLVTHASKNSIENHFDTSFELESMLEQRVKRQLLEDVRSICPSDLTVMHVRQGQAKGLGHAVLCAKPVIGDESFAVVLPDVILQAKEGELKNDLAVMKKRFEEQAASQILVQSVPDEEVCLYGIVKHQQENSVTISSIVEKPPVESAPSNLAVVGRYIFSASIWNYLEKTTADHSGEIQLTDAIDALIETETVESFLLQGEAHDCGSKLGYVKAFITHALQDPNLKDETLNFLKEQVL